MKLKFILPLLVGFLASCGGEVTPAEKVAKSEKKLASYWSGCTYQGQVAHTLLLGPATAGRQNWYIVDKSRVYNTEYVPSLEEWTDAPPTRPDANIYQWNFICAKAQGSDSYATYNICNKDWSTWCWSQELWGGGGKVFQRTYNRGAYKVYDDTSEAGVHIEYASAPAGTKVLSFEKFWLHLGGDEFIGLGEMQSQRSALTQIKIYFPY
jgi:hypothetical protein